MQNSLCSLTVSTRDLPIWIIWKIVLQQTKLMHQHLAPRIQAFFKIQCPSVLSMSICGHLPRVFCYFHSPDLPRGYRARSIYMHQSLQPSSLVWLRSRCIGKDVMVLQLCSLTPPPPTWNTYYMWNNKCRGSDPYGPMFNVYWWNSIDLEFQTISA